MYLSESVAIGDSSRISEETSKMVQDIFEKIELVLKKSN